MESIKKAIGEQAMKCVHLLDKNGVTHEVLSTYSTIKNLIDSWDEDYESSLRSAVALRIKVIGGLTFANENLAELLRDHFTQLTYLCS